MLPTREEIVRWYDAICGKENGLPGWSAKKWGEKAKVDPARITQMLKRPDEAPMPRICTLRKLAAKAPIPPPWAVPRNFLIGSTNGGDNQSQLPATIEAPNEPNLGGASNMRNRLIVQIMMLLPTASNDTLAEVLNRVMTPPGAAPGGRESQRNRP